jgi:hypothetical protein
LNDIVCEIQKNAQEKIIFRVDEYKRHRFIDMRVFVPGPNGGQDIPTKKGLAVSPNLWPEFKKALSQVEEAMIREGWLDQEDLEAQQG